MNTAIARQVSRINAGRGSSHLVELTAANDVQDCGGKACSLGKMLRLGINVPPGFVITESAFQEFLDHNNLSNHVADLLDGLDATACERLRTASESIRARILDSTIPVEIWESITAWRDELLPGMPLAVRSSAIGEDSIEAAFAGQLDSFLNVQSDHSLRDALLGCWASYWSHRSLFYQLSRGIRLNGMAVVIQRMVPSRISGVLFTRHPHPSDDGLCPKKGSGPFNMCFHSRENTTPRGPDPFFGQSHDDDDQEDALIAEYCFGSGDTLVSGKINPGRFSIDRGTRRFRNLAMPEQDGNSGQESGVTSHERDDRWLSQLQIRQLADAGIELEEAFGCPQDIEWTIDCDGRVYLVQSRPITTHVTRMQSRQIGLKNGRTTIWSNANVNENFPEPITPLLYSIATEGYYHYFRNLGVAVGLAPNRIQAMEHALHNIIGVHGARMYYNLSSIHACLRMAPCGELLIQWFNHFVGAAQVASESDAASWTTFRRSRLATAVEICRIAIQGAWKFSFLAKHVATFEKTVDAFAKVTEPQQLERRSLPELLENLRSFMHIRCHCWTNASLADAASMISYGLLKRFLNREFPGQDMSSLHNSLLKGLRDIVSGAPIVDLWNLSRTIRRDVELDRLFAAKRASEVLAEIRGDPKHVEFRAAFEQFLENWGFRCSGELMLTIPSYQENQESLIEIIQAYSRLDDESPSNRLQQQESHRFAETKRVLRRLRSRVRFFSLPRFDKSLRASILLKSAHRSIALRERARLKQALLYSRCRRIALAIGTHLVRLDHLENIDDVFLLSYCELESLLAGSAMFPHHVRQLVSLRKSAHLQLSAMDPPDSFELTEGCYLRGDEAHPALQNRASHAADSTEMSGVGACGGTVTARAAILTDMSECHLLSHGDILVAKQTDPGWGPAFFLIKGLVLERGGMLSHGAILAREYGIPTVVGVANATHRIAHGQMLCVNGDRGVVQLANS
jgi:phosphohistidine swiveling domain-containing protein